MGRIAEIIKKLMFHKTPAVIITACAVLVIVYFVLNGSAPKDFSEKYQGADLNGISPGAADGRSVGRTNTYTRYLERYAHIPPAEADIPLDIFSWSSASGVSRLNDVAGVKQVVRIEEESFIEYTVHVEKAGMYNVYIEYYPLPSRGIAIERAFKINGGVPFLGADRLMFQRVWGDADDVRKDNQGNEIRPAQIEKPRWESAYFRDSLGYSTEPYEFYLDAGDSVLRIEGINEPMALRALYLKAPVPAQTYRQYAQEIFADKYRNTLSNYTLKIQGEDADYRSDPSLYAIYDRSSGATDKPSVAKIKLNMIGGQSWRVAGQWIEWEFYVPENGMYKFTVKGRQNYNRGFVSNRMVMIDGQTPCMELFAVPFTYNNKWKLTTFRDGEGDMVFPLEHGRHRLRLQVAMGEMGDMLSVMEESVYRLNWIYRKILVLTGTEPDIYRDYRVDVVYPEVIEAMDLESKILYKLVDDLTAYSGERSAQAAHCRLQPQTVPALFQGEHHIPLIVAECHQLPFIVVGKRHGGKFHAGNLPVYNRHAV